MWGEVLNGIIGGLIPTLLALLGGLVFLGRKLEQIDKSAESIETIETQINEFSKTLAKLEEFKISTQKFIDNKIYQSQSPLSLTEFGEKLIKDSGFRRIFDKEKDVLVAELEKKQPKTKYDVQEKARELMNELQEYLPFQAIKKYAFEHGQDYGQILRAGAIPLRDYFLKKHPEITAS